MKYIVSRIPDTLLITGIPSHKEYIFSNENNHTLPVGQSSTTNPQIINPEDMEDLLKKTKKQGCCGSPVEIIQIFELIEQS
jgi:hypothetical protein